MFNRFLSKAKALMGVQFANYDYRQVPSDVDEVLKTGQLSRSDLLKLLYDDEIYACTERRIGAVLGNQWRIEGDNSDELYRAVEHIHEQAVRLMMQALWIGSSIGEIIYKTKEDGGIAIDSIAPRKIENFTSKQGKLYWRSPIGENKAVLPEKVLRAQVNAHDDNPYGDALLSRIYWAWFNKRVGEQFWSKYAERHASPITVLKANVNAVNQEHSQDELASLAAAGAQAVAAGFVAMDKEDEILFVEAHGDGEAHAKFIGHQIKRIQKTLIGRVLTSDLEHGSRAAQQTDDNFTQIIAESDLSFCEKGINHLIQCLLTLNGKPADNVYFSYQRQFLIDDKRWQRDVALVQTGQLSFSAQYFLDNYGLEPEHFQVAPKAQALSLSLSLSQLTPSAQELERHITNHLPEAPPISDIIDLMSQAKDETDLIRRLSLYYDDHDPMHFSDWLAQSLSLAQAQGFAQADKGQF